MQVLLVRAFHVAEVLPTGDGVLVGLHPVAAEAPYAVGDHHERGVEAPRVTPVHGLDAGHPA